MNIQKEREAFENWHIRNMDTNSDFEKISGQDSPYMDEHVNNSWLAWQAAKAQAVPDGFVLIPKKLPDELNDQLWDFMTDNFVCVNDYGDSFMACDDFDLDKFYAELIEAQEPK